MFDEFYNKSHNVWGLLNDLTNDELDAVQTLIILIGGSDDARANAKYYTGVLDGLKMTRFNICPTCEAPHDEGDKKAFEEMMKKKAQGSAEISAASAGPANFLSALSDTDKPDDGPGAYL